MKKVAIITISILFTAGLYLVFFFPSQKTDALTIGKTTDYPNLRNGLVGWWTMDGNVTTANTTTDKSGNAYNGTRSAGTKVIRGKIGQAMNFNGTNSSVNTGITGDLGSKVTISAWVKFNKMKGVDRDIIVGSKYYVDDEFAFEQHDVNDYLLFSIGSGKYASWYAGVSTSSPIWYNLVVVFDPAQSANADKAKLYVNGILKSQAAFLGITATDTLYATTSVRIGGGSIAQSYFDGGIDDVRIYNRVLSLQEIAQLYSMGGGKINKSDQTRAELRNGLLTHWSFDGKDTTSTQFLDRSGRGKHASRNGGVKTTSGIIGQAVRFDGNDDALYFTHNNEVSTTSPYSMSFWVKMYTVAGTNEVLIFDSSGTNNDNHGCFLTSLNNISCGQHNGAAFSGKRTGVIEANKWYHVAYTNNLGTVTMYVNGILQTTSGSSGLDNAAEIGYRSAWGAINAKMDDIRIYGRVLPYQQILQLYAMGGGKINKTDLIRSQLRDGLVGHWTFDGKDVTVNTTTDKSGNGYNGTRTGTKVSTGKIGQGLSLNGTSDNVALGDPYNYLTSTPYSFSVWIKNDTQPSGGVYAPILSKTDYEYTLGFKENSNQLVWNYWDTAGSDSTKLLSTTVVKNRWYHVVVTYDGVNTGRMYLNGVLDGTDTSVTANQYRNLGTNLLIGQGYAFGTGAGYYWKGRVDDLRIYNRALSASEIKQLYYMGR